MRGKNLKNNNDCDPYCLLKYNNKLDKDIIWETPSKKKKDFDYWIGSKC